MIQPANRVTEIQEYYFSRKLKEVAKLNAEGMDIISLAIGSPDMPPSKQTIDKLCEVANNPNAHGYQPTVGIPELRKAMAGFYKRWYDVDLDWATEIQPLIGSKEGILHVTLAFCNPGDEVLIPNPGYPTYTAINKILGTKITYYDLREDNGWQPDFDALEKMDLSHVKLMWTNYPNMPTGGVAKRETYENWYDVDLDWATEIQPLIGSKEGILHVTLAFCNPGDEVLIPNPGYPTYTAINKILGTKITYYDLREDNGWQPDFDALEKMDLSHVKLMWTNYPNMPTGGVAKRETYEKLVAFAQKHNIVVVNDNPYSLILNEHPMSIMQVPGAKDCCIEFNSLSKSHNMPGWRVAMISSNKTFISWILKVKSNIDNGSFRGIQLAAAEAMLNNTDEWHHENNIVNYRRRRDIAEEIMKVLDCQFDPNQVGMFLWGKIPEKYTDVEDLTEKILHEARVFITPGFIFGSNGKRYIRISLCAKDEKMKEALERIKKVFES
jgi:LL-diaminopimelate aminotransferase